MTRKKQRPGTLVANPGRYVNCRFGNVLRHLSFDESESFDAEPAWSDVCDPPEDCIGCAAGEPYP